MKIYRQVFIFLFVGVTSAIVDVGGLFILNNIFLIPSYTSITIAYFISLMYNYLAHTLFTFQSNVNISNIFRFIILVIFNYSLTILIVFILTVWLFLSVIWAKVVSLPIIAFSTFMLSKYWVYKK